MSPSLEEIRAISDIAKLLYSFLPGNPHPYADRSISFKGIAYELGLGSFWQKRKASFPLLQICLKIRWILNGKCFAL